MKILVGYLHKSNLQALYKFSKTFIVYPVKGLQRPRYGSFVHIKLHLFPHPSI